MQTPSLPAGMNHVPDQRSALAPASPRAEATAFSVHFAVLSAFLWAMVSLGLRSWNDFAYLLREDGAFETLTAAFLFLASGLAHLLATELRSLGRRKLAVLFWVGAGLFFVVGMEEISWGQRLLLLKTPEGLSKVNVQGELNLHNVEGIHGRNEIRVSLVIGAWGSISGALIAFAVRAARPGSRLHAFLESLRWFTVPTRYAPYFLQMFAYVMLRRHDSRWLQVFPEKRLIKELVECVFALGCYLVLLFRLRTAVPRLRSAQPPRMEPQRS